MLTCLHCNAEVSNGLALCDLCQQKARLALEYLPVYYRNLARWRPGRAGSRPVPGSRVLYDGTVRGDGTGDRISDRLDSVNNDLTTWARTLSDARPHVAKMLDRLAAARAAERVDEIEAVTWLCRGFDRYLVSVSTLDWCGEFVRDLGRHERTLEALTQALIPGWYAGGCRHCGSGTHVVPGLTWVVCAGCGATTAARDHLETILDEARGWVAPPKRLAEAVVALIDGELSVPRVYARIRKWAEREQIGAHHRIERGYAYDVALERMVVADNQVGQPRYQLGEVLDMVWARESRSKSGTLAS